MEMEGSVVFVSFCCFFAHICSRPSLLLSADRVPRQTEKDMTFVMSFFLSGGFNSDIFGQGPQIVAGANERAPIYKKSEQVICSLLRRAIT